MSAEIVWDDEAKTLCTVEMRDEWKWQDFSDKIKEAYNKIATYGHDVNFVFGFYSKMPEGEKALPHLTLAGHQPKNIRHTVIVNQSGLASKLFMESLVSSVAKVNEWNGPKFLDTMEEARAYFERLKEFED
jgi:hypothetical protein